MKTDLVGTLVQLPDGRRAKIEIVHEDGYASVRRVDGEWSGRMAVCSITKLKRTEPAGVGLAPLNDLQK